MTDLAASKPLAGALHGSELLRKLLHVSMGGFAFALVYLGPLWGAVFALTAVLFNLFLLPHIGGRKMWRTGEHSAGASHGMVLYAVAVLLLILIFWRRLEVAAAAWGILAVGDGLATIFGMAFGRRKLPWNPAKSWVGSLAYVVFGGLAAATLLLWTAPHQGYSWPFALACGFAAALLAAGLESMPQGLDDNIGVPLVSALFLFGLVLTHGKWFDFLDFHDVPRRLLWAVGINAALAVAAYFARSVDLSGALTGFLLGVTIYVFLDWQGYLLLIAFFVIGTGCTKIGYRKKAAAHLAQEKGGRRSMRHALANSGVAAACAVFGAVTDWRMFFICAFAGAFATAAADTASSEIGQLLGRRTFLITTLRPVPRGTEGAVSLEGTLAGIAASLVVAGLAVYVDLLPAWTIGVVAVAAFVGTTFESVVGAALEKKALLDNEALNFLNTLVGALVAAAGSHFLVGVLA